MAKWQEDDGVLLEEVLPELKLKKKDKEGQDILSQLRVEHPITYDGYDICDLVKTEAISRFTVKEPRVMCYQFEMP